MPELGTELKSSWLDIRLTCCALGLCHLQLVMHKDRPPWTSLVSPVSLGLWSSHLGVQPDT